MPCLPTHLPRPHLRSRPGHPPCPPTHTPRLRVHAGRRSHQAVLAGPWKGRSLANAVGCRGERGREGRRKLAGGGDCPAVSRPLSRAASRRGHSVGPEVQCDSVAHGPAAQSRPRPLVGPSWAQLGDAPGPPPARPQPWSASGPGALQGEDLPLPAPPPPRARRGPREKEQRPVSTCTRGGRSGNGEPAPVASATHLAVGLLQPPGQAAGEAEGGGQRVAS